MILYIVLSRRGRHVTTTADWAWAQRLRLAFRGRVVPVLRQSTLAEQHQDERVAA